MQRQTHAGTAAGFVLKIVLFLLVHSIDEAEFRAVGNLG